MDEQELEELYGPTAFYSDYEVGERLTFTEGDQVYAGVIRWICAPGEEAGRQLPVRYIVETDLQDGFPHVVWPGDIIEVR